MRYLFLYLIAILLLTSCQCAPDRKDFKTDLEYMISDCSYRNNKNPISCVKLTERYAERDKEKSYTDRLEYCKDKNNLPENWDLTKCLYYVNQK